MAGVIALLLCALLGGCVEQPVLVNDRVALAALTSVSVATVVDAPEQLYYHSAGQSQAGLLLGIVGAAAARSGVGEVEQRLEASMVERGQPIGTIVRDTVVDGIRASGVPATLVESPAQAELRLQVEFYGLAPNPRDSSGLVPTLRVRGTLVDRSGAVIWERVRHADVEDPSHRPAPLETLLAQPELLVEAYRNASRLIWQDFSAALRSA